jgi:hypothetical protein
MFVLIEQDLSRGNYHQELTAPQPGTMRAAAFSFSANLH